MDKKKVLRIAGTALTILGGTALYLGGTTEAVAASLVGGVFLIAAIVAGVVRG